MKRLVALMLLGLVAPMAAHGQNFDDKITAQKILDAGAALFDKKDAQVMAATYVEDGVLIYTSKDNDTGLYKSEAHTGREAIQKVYAKLFENGSAATSRNVVESAVMLKHDLLLIRGTFQPDISNDGKFPFVQVRTLRGDKWQILTLEIFILL